MTKLDRFANDFAAAVVSAFSEVYGPPRNADVKASVRTSWSEGATRQGWTDPDPRFVLVGTEHGWINDPWSSDRDHQLWDKAVNSLMRDGWGDVHWDSINPGIHTVFIDLPSAWHGVLIKRALEKGKAQR